MELALVVLVAGLLFATTGAVREMLAGARAKRLTREFVAVRLAIDTYQDRFHALPGDDPFADRHAPGADVASGAGDGLIDGAWNGATAGSEAALLWQHLQLAGLAPPGLAADGADPRPRHVADGRIGANSPVAGQRQVEGLGGSLQVCADGVPGRLAKAVDRLLDDGDTAAGAMRAVPHASPPNARAIATGALDDGGTVTLCHAH